MSREEDVTFTLQLQNIRGILDVHTIPDNQFFALYEYDGRQLCNLVTEGKIFFNLADSPKINALALYREKTVIVCRGMLEAILKIAAELVTRGAYPRLGNLADREWIVNPDQLFPSAHETLKSLTPFTCDKSRFPWLESEDRLALFTIISSTMFRFVVLHELGHFFHGHGQRSSEDHFVEFDGVAGPDSGGNVDAQARETSADAYAFGILLQLQRDHLKSQKHESFGRRLANEFHKSDEDLAVFLSSIVFIYFHMTESSGIRQSDPNSWRHPPAAFRLTTVLAGLLEHGALAVPAEAGPRILQTAVLRSEALLTTMLDRLHAIEWLGSMNDPKFLAQYSAIYEALPRWSSSAGPRWNEDSTEHDRWTDVRPPQRTAARTGQRKSHVSE